MPIEQGIRNKIHRPDLVGGGYGRALHPPHRRDVPTRPLQAEIDPFLTV